jgi:NAD(P)-dependent dehydrogenase (short-subunit alcohol dehydrogenase family)
MIMNDKETEVSKGLNGKRIVLLGGTSGVGLATAIAAANEGANIVVVSSSQNRVDNALAALSPGSEGYTCNLTDEEQVKELFKRIGEFDHLAFTAGEALQLMELSTVDIAKAREFFNLRYWGALMTAKYASLYIRKGGSITLTTGTAGLRPWKGWTVAASITGAVDALTRALAVELAPIRVNAVCPGVVKTELWSSMSEADQETLFTDIGSKLLTGKVGESDEVAEAYLYLMRGNYTTGQVIVVDGGSVLV